MARVFSGIQPTGQLHVGNYLGAIRNWVAVQAEHDCVFSIVDLHAMTIPYDPAELPQRVLATAATLIGCGIDPERSILYVQSHVREHSELCWILNCITPLGSLQRMTQFKDKAKQHQENVNAGLLNYPILQAADILLYKAALVPVGEDQVQHLELSRDLARRFNHLFGETFPEPQALLTRAARVMALNDPTRKMSKSIPGSFVALTAPPEEIQGLIRRAVTDTGPRGESMSPGVANLFTLLESFSAPETVAQFREAYEQGALRYVDLKQQLAEDMVRALTPIRERYTELMSRQDELKELLAYGADRARAIARDTMEEVRDKTGLVLGTSAAAPTAARAT
ncbi:MAG: tryptophan--tRNA ligase [Firmicutes bacterium ZCTH02-B6]|nr:MAG: tryptophan--tRNA ligase [Firmicutes bacterium ZCTH02-B6]